MPKFTTFGGRSLTTVQKYSTVGLVVSAAALTLNVLPGPGGAETASAQTTTAAPAAFDVKAADVAGQQENLPSQSGPATGGDNGSGKGGNTGGNTNADQPSDAEQQKQKQAGEEMAKAKKDYAEKLANERSEQSANRTADRPATQYADNLDGWIKESLAIMEKQGIPGSYEGLQRNIMRESGGDPNAINNWDINAKNGVPSQGLLQVIPPTFQAYHVAGTSWNITDPVANITAAANYAADRYGSIDNVNGPY